MCMPFVSGPVETTRVAWRRRPSGPRSSRPSSSRVSRACRACGFPELELLCAPVAAKAAQLLIVLIALFVVGGLIEGDQGHEVVARVGAQAAGLSEAARHLAGEVAPPLDDELQIVGRAEPRCAGERAIGEALWLLVLV